MPHESERADRDAAVRDAVQVAAEGDAFIQNAKTKTGRDITHKKGRIAAVGESEGKSKSRAKWVTLLSFFAGAPNRHTYTGCVDGVRSAAWFLAK